MISHCANSECGAPFHYLRGGRLYRFEIPSPLQTCEEIPNAICTTKPSRMTVYFWLCEQCSSRLALKFNPKRGLLLTSLTPGARRGRTAPVIVENKGKVPAGMNVVREERVVTCPVCRPPAAQDR